MLRSKVLTAASAYTSSIFLGTSVGGSLGAPSTFTCDFPAEASEGDLVVAQFSADSASVTQTTPTGWTLINAGDSAEYPRMYVYAKVLGFWDIYTGSLTVTPSSSVNYTAQMAAFKITGYDSISNLVYKKGPSALSGTVSGFFVSYPAIGMSFLTGRPGQSPVLSWGSTYEALVEDTNPAGGTCSFAYRLSDSLQSIGVSSTDTGRQALTAFYMEL